MGWWARNPTRCWSRYWRRPELSAAPDIPGLAALRVDHRLRAADDEGLVALEEIGHHFGERLWAIGADRVPGVIDENQVAIGHQLLVDVTHIGRDDPVDGAEQHERRRREPGELAFEIGVAVRTPQPRDQRPRFRLHRRVRRRYRW